MQPVPIFSFLPSFLLGTRHDSTDFCVVLILLIWGTHSPTSVFKYYRQAAPLYGKCIIVPTILGAEYMSPCYALPPLVYACIRAVKSGGCVIDLLIQGWASTSSLSCLVSGNNANIDNLPVPTSPFCIPRIWQGDGRREMKNHLRYSHTFPTNRPDRVSNLGRHCDRPVCLHYTLHDP